METIYSTIQHYQPDLVSISIIGLFLFAAGFWVGQGKSKKLERKMAKMEKEIRDLNTELLYNTGEPVVVKMRR